ncbi:ComEC/Rec2 family competence protein [Microbacterium yannicii]|uniref:ComEC/Rec2 family competence protein n=1 Tax=Microbacterium yannicii TaxID=671622 RepID=UPI0002E742E3|nr:ComEC/Rec2 family competence protein [Microbacterium yannicii]
MSRRRTGRLRLLPVLAATWSTGATAILAPSAAGTIAIVLWVAGLGGVVVLACRCGRRTRHAGSAGAGRRTALVIVLSLAASAAAASHVALAQPARAEMALLANGDGRALEVTAEVVGKIERRTDGSLAFDAIALDVSAGRHHRAVRAEILVRVAPGDVDGLPSLDVGAIVAARGTASPGRPGERAVAVLWAARGVDVRQEPGGVTGVAAGLRQGLLAAVGGLPGPGAGLVPGLAVGDTSAVDPALDAAMKESSLSHLTAVSGANCALVVGIAFAAAAAAGASRAARVGIGLTSLAGFVILVTPEPSVVRAGAMAAVAMTCVLLGRAGAGMGLLSLAATIVLIADPWLAAFLGFALSTVATASLLLFAGPFAAGLGRTMPGPLALALSVPLAAQLACGPLLVLIAPQVPLYGVAANLLAGPAAPATTVIGLAACLSAPLPWLQSGLAAIAWVPASWIAAVATTISELPGDLVPWMEGIPGAASLGAVGVAVGLLIAAPRGGRASRWARGASAALVASVVGMLLGTGALTTVAGRWTLPADWSVLACDIGQGDAVLLRSAGVVALVDTGPDPELLDACLARTGVQRVDLLVLTHFDLDHAGGVSTMVGRVGTVLHGPVDPEQDHVLRTLGSGGATLVSTTAGMTGSLGDARWRALWPQAQSRAFPPGNDASVVIDVRGGGIPPTLLLGDLSASPQRAIEASGALDPPYAVVKVAHHGSADQHAGLYTEAAPALALVTVGAENDYGHPRDEILEVLEAAGARIARTDRDGVVAVSTGETGLSVWRERGG